MAKNLLYERPMETVSLRSSQMRFCKRIKDCAGVPPCNASVPERSMNASSMESGSTCGVSVSIVARMARPSSTYLRMSPRTTLACGQSFKALNIGMAERTP